MGTFSPYGPITPGTVGGAPLAVSHGWAAPWSTPPVDIQPPSNPTNTTAQAFRLMDVLPFGFFSSSPDVITRPPFAWNFRQNRKNLPMSQKRKSFLPLLAIVCLAFTGALNRQTLLLHQPRPTHAIPPKRNNHRGLEKLRPSPPQTFSKNSFVVMDRENRLASAQCLAAHDLPPLAFESDARLILGPGAAPI